MSQQYEHNGLIYFRIYGVKDGVTKELCELEEDCEDIDEALERLHEQIYNLFGKYLENLRIPIRKCFYQVETYTNNAGPLIDYCVVTSEKSAKLPVKNFTFELVEQGEWTIHATSVDVPPKDRDFARLLRDSVAKYAL